jgi:hypothetical protein
MSGTLEPEPKMVEKYTHDELIKQIKKPGWTLNSEEPDKAVSGTLEDLLNTTHEQQTAGNVPGLIKQAETSIELDMIEIEKLWRYLGLPV